MRLIYILSASHSGSTLLTFLLNAHQRVATVGELAPTAVGNVDHYHCSCGAEFRKCAFWKWLCRAAREQGKAFDLEDIGTRFWMPQSRYVTHLLRPLHRKAGLESLRDMALRLHPGWDRTRASIANTNVIVVGLIMRYFQSHVFVDKGNVAVRLKYLLRIPEFDISVIRLIRDGRGVALAYMDPARFADARNPGQRGDREAERKRMRAAAHEWRRSNEEAENVLSGIERSRWIEVRYEDLCAKTDAEMGRIFRFLRLDDAQRANDFRAVEHHIVGNGMRLDSTSAVRPDERWRSVLSDGDLREFDVVAGELNRRYGYV